MLQFARYYALLLVTIMLHHTVTAQECGSEPTAANLQYIKQLYRNAAQSNFKTNDTVYIPIRAHFITRDDSTGAITYAQLDNEVNTINQYYVGAKVQFFLCDSIHYIYDSDYYDFKKTVDEEFTADIYDEANKLNIYFAGNLYRTNSNNDTTYLCGYAYFPPGPDRILMDYSCSINGSTLAHEIGHYLSLLHTHDTGNGDELVDGSNCSSAGDLFCDTPADPNLNGKVSTACIYTGTATDDNGDSYVPDVTNLMSYSRKSCRDNFSPEQIQAIAYSAVVDRDYLTTRPVADFGINTNSYTVLLSNFSTNATDYIWDFGDGNTSTDMEPLHTYADTGSYTICLFASSGCKTYSTCANVVISCASFRAEILYEDLSANDLVVNFSTGLQDSANVIWDFGDGSTSIISDVDHEYSAPGEYTVTLWVENDCGTDSTSSTITVRSIVSVEDVAKAWDIKVFPNPAQNRLNISGAEELRTAYYLFDLTGRMIKSGTDRTIDVSALQQGVYILQLKDEQGQHLLTERVVVSR